MVTTSDVSIGLLIHDLARQMRNAFDVRARGLGVTRAQWRALLYLSRNEGATQAATAEALEVERIWISRMIDKLVDNGLVERRADPADRRVWRLHLLPPAHELVKKLNQIGMQLENECTSDLSAARRQEVVEALTSMREKLRRPRDGSECERKQA